MTNYLTMPQGNINEMSTEEEREIMMNDETIPLDKKLELSEQANHVFRHQLAYLQNHVEALRALVQEKESIIENLMLRYDLGILPQGMSQVDIDDKDLRRKAEALAQRTVLENFELRELVNELRDENFYLRTDIYNLQDKLNRQALYISKMVKNGGLPVSVQDDIPLDSLEDEMAMLNSSPMEAMAQEALRKHEERAKKHNRQQSSLAQPKDFWGRESVGEEKYQETNPNNNTAASSTPTTNVTTPTIMTETATEIIVPDRTKEIYMNEEAQKKREERQEKSHEKNNTLVTPEDFFESNTSHPSASPPTDDHSPHTPTNPNNTPHAHDKADKQRGSKQLNEEDIKNTKQATLEHQNKERSSQKKESIKIDYANTEEAKRIREEREKKARKESIAMPKGFLSAKNTDADSEDDESREKRRKSQRRRSLMNAIGDKGHLSDEDTEKTQHVDYELRKKMDRLSRQKGGNPDSSAQTDEVDLRDPRGTPTFLRTQSHHLSVNPLKSVKKRRPTPANLDYIKDLTMEETEYNNAAKAMTAANRKLSSTGNPLRLSVVSVTKMTQSPTLEEENKKSMANSRPLTPKKVPPNPQNDPPTELTNTPEEEMLRPQRKDSHSRAISWGQVVTYKHEDLEDYETHKEHDKDTSSP